MALGLFLFAGSALAQISVDSEEQRRRAQQEAEERLLRQQAPDVRLQAPTPALETDVPDLPDETPCFRIDRLQLEGARVESFAWLEGPLAAYAGRCLGPQGINRIIKRVSALIVARGFVTTRVSVPEQDLMTGTLRLALVPGVIRAIRIEGEASERNWLSAFPTRPGELLNLRDIEQGLEQMKRLPSQDVSIDIAPGEAPGESDVVLTVQRAKPWRLSLSLDDTGAKETGRLQSSLDFAFDNLLGVNDLLNVSASRDADRESARHRTRSHSFKYSVPWGYWTLTLSDSASHYQQTVKGANQSFRSSGDAQNQEVKLQRLVYRDQAAQTTLQFRLLHRASRSYIEDTEILTQRRRTSSAELGITHRQYVGATQLDLALAHRQGVPWFGGESDAAGRGADAPTFGYRLQTLDLTASMPFSIGGQSARWLATLHGQSTHDVLYASEFLSIGNRYTVRGFDGNATLGAERGWFLRNELQFPLADSGQTAYAGLDYGRVSGPSARTLVGRQLSGAVVGLRGGGHGFSYEFFLGRAIAQPRGFGTSGPVAGFQLAYQL